MDPVSANGSKLKVSHSGIWEHTLAQFSAVSLPSSAELLPSTDSSALLSFSISGVDMIVMIVLSVSVSRKVIGVMSRDLLCHRLGACRPRC